MRYQREMEALLEKAETFLELTREYLREIGYSL